MAERKEVKKRKLFESPKEALKRPGVLLPGIVYGELTFWLSIIGIAVTLVGIALYVGAGTGWADASCVTKYIMSYKPAKAIAAACSHSVRECALPACPGELEHAYRCGTEVVSLRELEMIKPDVVAACKRDLNACPDPEVKYCLIVDMCKKDPAKCSEDVKRCLKTAKECLDKNFYVHWYFGYLGIAPDALAMFGVALIAMGATAGLTAAFVASVVKKKYREPPIYIGLMIVFTVIVAFAMLGYISIKA